MGHPHKNPTKESLQHLSKSEQIKEFLSPACLRPSLDSPEIKAPKPISLNGGKRDSAGTKKSVYHRDGRALSYLFL